VDARASYQCIVPSTRYRAVRANLRRMASASTLRWSHDPRRSKCAIVGGGDRFGQSATSWAEMPMRPLNATTSRFLRKHHQHQDPSGKQSGNSEATGSIERPSPVWSASGGVAHEGMLYYLRYLAMNETTVPNGYASNDRPRPVSSGWHSAARMSASRPATTYPTAWPTVRGGRCLGRDLHIAEPIGSPFGT
jgi:hypothetical protein